MSKYDKMYNNLPLSLMSSVAVKYPKTIGRESSSMSFTSSKTE